MPGHGAAERSSGADTIFIAATPKFAAQAIRKVFDIDWYPMRFVSQASSSVADVLAAAGLEKSKGVMTTTSFKTVGDPQWSNDPDYLAWLAFMRAYYPGGDINDKFAFLGYSNAALFAEVLRRCGDGSLGGGSVGLTGCGQCRCFVGVWSCVHVDISSGTRICGPAAREAPLRLRRAGGNFNCG